MKTKEYILRTLKTRKSDLFKPGIREVGLFGSYGREEQSEKSDLDILIDFDPYLEAFDNYLAVFDILERLFKNLRVEAVTTDGLGPTIGSKIFKEVKYV
jgi:uncharacterized protein